MEEFHCCSVLVLVSICCVPVLLQCSATTILLMVEAGDMMVFTIPFLPSDVTFVHLFIYSTVGTLFCFHLRVILLFITIHLEAVFLWASFTLSCSHSGDYDHHLLIYCILWYYTVRYCSTDDEFQQTRHSDGLFVSLFVVLFISVLLIYSRFVTVIVYPLRWKVWNFLVPCFSAVRWCCSFGATLPC